MHKLTIEDDEGKTVVVPLIRDEITVGRQEGNSIRLTERNISRRHARFYRQSGTLYVEDLGSYNGIRVNGSKIAAATALKDGDLVIVGDYKLTVRADRPVSTRLYAGGAPFQPVTGGPAAAGGTAPLPGPISLQGVAGGASATVVSSAAGNPSLAPTAPLPVQPPPAAPVPSITPIRPGAASQAPPPDSTLDAAPTIPVRTLAEQGLADGAPPARLVAVSTGLAGSEFTLDRPSLVIGRTPENDIVLNHKSISRHHAKIIRDGDKYIVVDLESANGVRVNGSEFERVELQTGDTVELGHVKLKFSTGNDYIDFDVAAGGGNRRKLMIGGAVGAVALAGVVLALAAGGSRDKKPATTAAVTNAAPAEGATAMPDPVAPTPTPPVGPEVQALLDQAKSAMQSENWAAASDAIKRAMQAAPASADAITLRETIDSELQASERFNRLKQAADGKNYEEVLTLFPTIPESSVYRSRAVPLKETAQGKLVAQNLTEAERLEGRGQCDEARTAVERVTALEPDNGRARTIIEKCDKRAGRQAEKQKREDEAAARQTAAAEKQAEREAAATRADRRAAASGTPASTADVRPPQPRTVAAATPERSPRLAERPAPSPTRAEARAAAPAPRPAAARPAAAPPPPPAPPAEVGDPDALIQEATQSWLRGQYAAAIETSRKALRIRPNTVRAYQIIAVCSCNLRDTDSATKAYEKLEERMKPLVKSACAKNGINLQ
jgi:pSer/pThr/pTyr-binding forkhead associated (FHA) protein/tetratricopeptide (TPR) repeat protein